MLDAFLDAVSSELQEAVSLAHHVVVQRQHSRLLTLHRRRRRRRVQTDRRHEYTSQSVNQSVNQSVYSPVNNAGLMPTEARGNYFPEPPYLCKTKTYHSQPLESIQHAGNFFYIPLSIRPILIFCCCRSYVKLLDY